MIRVEALPAVIKARQRCRAPGVVAAFNELVERLLTDPVPGPPDRREIWRKAWPEIPNHRHADLPGGWRACWTVRREGADDVVTVLFLGTHGRYDRLYGFG